MGRQDKQDKDKKKKKKKREYHTVIEELDGTLVCSCSEFDATAKTCLQISAARLYRDFGPPERYSNPEKKKDSGSRNKRQKKEKPGATLKKEKGPRPPADHLIEDEHESFLQLLEDSEYDPFPAADESVKPQPSGTIGKCISSGRPAAITAHQPGRSPTKFSKKPGPKGHGYNSLLPPLSNKSPRKSLVKIPGQAPSGSTSDESSDSELSKPKVPPIPLKDKGKAKAAPESHDQGPAVMAEDLDILDIKFGRWDDEAYTLRQDEEFEICQLINAVALGMHNGVLVVGDSYAHDAKQLCEDVVWTVSDDEPINARGAPAFGDDTILKKAWLHSQEIALEKLLAFHHDPVRKHWLLFASSLGKTSQITCYEPLASHGRPLDIQGISTLSAYFSPQRPAQPVGLYM